MRTVLKKEEECCHVSTAGTLVAMYSLAYQLFIDFITGKRRIP